MKKIALLFTIVCVGQMYGMEPLYPKRGTGTMGAFEELPQDVHDEIIKMALATSDTLEETVKAINVVSALRGVKYDNLEDFTKLVHMLADKFGISSTRMIAMQFNTPIAKEYRDLGELLITNIEEPSVHNVIKLINQGADVNYSSLLGVTPLRSANWVIETDFEEFAPDVRKRAAEIMRILIEAGATRQ